jgi:hypothetical protein
MSTSVMGRRISGWRSAQLAWVGRGPWLTERALVAVVAGTVRVIEEWATAVQLSRTMALRAPPAMRALSTS